MSMRLIGDIGGTNARFALSGRDGAPREEQKLPVAEYPGLIEAAEAYLSGRPPVEDAVLAVATPVRGDEVGFTNSPWRFSIEEARQRLGLRRLAVINDFLAQATAIPALGGEDVRLLKPGPGRRGGPAVVIGPGTGLGVAFLLSSGEGIQALPSEAGHASFAPQNDLEGEVLRRLRARHSHVSAERLLSGPGLLSLAKLLAEIEGATLALQDPREVSERAAAGTCPHCLAALRMFSAILGSAAGNLALTILAEGGVFITGGLCRGLGPLLDLPSLTEGFTNKGRFTDYLVEIPIYQVLRPHTGLLGAAVYRHDQKTVPGISGLRG